MGPLQQLWSLTPPWWVLTLLCTTLGLVYFVSSNIARERRLRKLGPPAQVIYPHKLPFGFDTASRIFYSIFTHNFVPTVEKVLEHGHIVEVNIAGTPMIFTDEPEAFHAIMSTQFRDFGKGQLLHDAFAGAMSEAIFATDGDAWKNSRSILRPHTSRLRPDDLAITEEHCAHFIKQIRDQADVGSDVWDMVDRYQLDVITHVFFGKSTDCLITNKQPFRNAMERLLKVASYKLTFGKLGVLVPDWIVCPGALRELNNYIATLHEQAGSRKDPNSESILMDTLAARHLDFNGIKAQTTSVMLGGKDPPTLTMTWAIWELAKHPEDYRRLRQEVATICGFDSPPTREQLLECHFVRACANESMRLYHPLGINMKVALRDTTLPLGGGRTGTQPLPVAKGTPVLLSTYSMHRRKDLVGPDGHDWRPARWLEWQPEPWAYVPFNRGIRSCLGKDFGQEQVSYILCRIAQEFDRLELGEGLDGHMDYKFELNIKPVKPAIVRFIAKGAPTDVVEADV